MLISSRESPPPRRVTSLPLHGTITIPSVGNEPEEIAAP
jgi:hypothetical protein